MSILQDSTRLPRERSFRMSNAELGMRIFLVSLSVLFIATLVGFVVTRTNQVQWRAEGSPGLPWGLWASTAVIALLSLSGHAALRALGHNRYDAAKTRLGAMFGLAVVFLLMQAFNWSHMLSVEGHGTAKNMYVFTYFMLTGVHALHVLGGLVPLGWVLYGAMKRRYSSSRSESVALCVQYWDFLGVVWLVLLGALYWAS